MPKRYETWSMTTPSGPLLCGILALLLPKPCSATPESPPTQAIPEAVALDRGQPAPFDGILLTAEDAAALWEKLENQAGRLALEQKRCGERLAIENERSFKQLAVLRATSDEKLEIVKTALVECELAAKREWWEDPVTMAGIGTAAGAVVGVVVTVGAVWLGAQTLAVVD